MNEDPIVEEARRAGEALFAKHQNDMHAVVEYLRRCSEQAGRATISLPAKPPKPRAVVLEKKKVG